MIHLHLEKIGFRISLPIVMYYIPTQYLIDLIARIEKEYPNAESFKHVFYDANELSENFACPACLSALVQSTYDDETGMGQDLCDFDLTWYCELCEQFWEIVEKDEGKERNVVDVLSDYFRYEEHGMRREINITKIHEAVDRHWRKLTTNGNKSIKEK